MTGYTDMVAAAYMLIIDGPGKVRMPGKNEKNSWDLPSD